MPTLSIAKYKSDDPDSRKRCNTFIYFGWSRGITITAQKQIFASCPDCGFPHNFTFVTWSWPIEMEGHNAKYLE